MTRWANSSWKWRRHVDDSERRVEGMRVRRAILGDAHVDASIARSTEFTAEFQDLITRYAWGEIWTRPGLERNTRSLITMAMLIALGRDDEFEMHVRASAAAGVSRDEIKELLLQSAIYCGVPAANHAFRLAERAFAAMDAASIAPP
jgi:4-carboxymuconolactone decarboxylase